MDPLVSRSDEEYNLLLSNALSQSACFLFDHCGCVTLPDSMAAKTGSCGNQPFVIPQQASLTASMEYGEVAFKSTLSSGAPGLKDILMLII